MTPKTEQLYTFPTDGQTQPGDEGVPCSELLALPGLEEVK